MKEIGDKIKRIRKSKGFSQEALAEKSKVNVRTIQRIESGENSPHGKTLQLICEAMDIAPDEVLSFHLREDKQLLMWLYFSVGATMVLPLGGVLAPLIIWITNKKSALKVDRVGKNIVFNQVIISAFTFMFLVFVVFQKINHGAYDSEWGFLIYFILKALNVLYAVFAGIMAYKGKIMLYPLFR